MSRVVAQIHHSSPIDSIRRMFISTFCKYLTAVLIGHPVSRMDGNLTRADSHPVYWITIDISRALTFAVNSKCYNWESSCTPALHGISSFLFNTRVLTRQVLSNIFLTFRFFLIMSGSFREIKNKSNNKTNKKIASQTQFICIDYSFM